MFNRRICKHGSIRKSSFTFIVNKRASEKTFFEEVEKCVNGFISAPDISVYSRLGLLNGTSNFSDLL